MEQYYYKDYTIVLSKYGYYTIVDVDGNDIANVDNIEDAKYHIDNINNAGNADNT